MIDLKLLREAPGDLKAGIQKKKFSCDLAEVLQLDEKRRKQVAATESKRAEQKAVNQTMAALEKGSPEFISKVQEMKGIAAEVKAMEAELKGIEDAWQAAFMSIPNVPDPSVPVGKGEADNVTLATWGDTESVSKHACPHYDIAGFNRLIDFPRGVKVTGAGFPFYVGDMARLVRSLIQFFLQEAHARGYQEVLPPIVVNEASGIATGQLPDKEGMMYEDPKEGMYLIPTAEVPVTNFFRDEILEERDLPIYRSAYTPCFRREAGSWGKDVRGLNRLHQFDKVEIVKWVHPTKSAEELESLRQDAESLLQKLELPYRVLQICTGDMGFPHAKQYDLEVWAGGQKRWLEVSSCSNFTDFQARRANIRFRPKEGGKPVPVHTLNGSALAIPRVLAAILENNHQEDGTVIVPEVLKPWFGEGRIRFD